MNLIPCKNIIIAFLFAVLCSCGSTSKKDGKHQQRTQIPSALPVEGYIVVPVDLKSNIQVAGTLIPMQETEIHPEVSGKITMLSLKEGAYIRRGTLIARLFDGDLRAQLQKLKVQLEVAEKTQQRQNDLLKIGGISQQDYDLSALSVSSLKADIAVLQTDIDKTYIRAPFNGRLGFKNVSIGAYVTPQTIITTIRQTDQLKLEFSIPEKYTRDVKVGGVVAFTTESQNGKFQAKIMSTESGINENTRSLAVHAVVPNASNNLRPGGFATVTFDLGDNKDAVMIPNQSIIPEARDKKVILYKGGKAFFTVVETGVRESDKIEITKGIEKGDTVITTGLLAIKPEGRITISSYYNNKENN